MKLKRKHNLDAPDLTRRRLFLVTPTHLYNLQYRADIQSIVDIEQLLSTIKCRSIETVAVRNRRWSRRFGHTEKFRSSVRFGHIEITL